MNHIIIHYILKNVGNQKMHSIKTALLQKQYALLKSMFFYIFVTKQVVWFNHLFLFPRKICSKTLIIIIIIIIIII